MRKDPIRKSAFSLVEMAIVLIIIGILASTAFVAIDIKQGAAVRLAAKEIEEINVAISNFYDSFHEVPGDFDKTTQYWPNDCSGGASACNGDGDNIIEAYKEAHLAWLHLSAANLYPGQFTGAGDGDSNTETAGINVPASVFNGAQYAIIHYEWDEFPDQHMILLAAKKNSDVAKTRALDANSAYELDARIDDGKPGSGSVYGRNGYNGSDWDSTTCIIDTNGDRVANSETINSSWEYDMNRSTKECIMGFKLKNQIANDVSK